ncbi:type III secretion system export apparatus subunit SctV [Agarilytica rhodophyticola]|uniref:type III secretion system export apparatus subunit SctV n=1 Tax=Agarilytica rhodophyticola TaxID=1737490 RepID=UPI000B341544|nr:type III secretion system export apparatus subunit SctV [Agarilytica rhodophyticola]
MSFLNKIVQLLVHRSEVIVAVFVVGIIFMMILPMPTGLVDVLIALNITISTILVVMVMYMPGPLAFSTFPALLLITTLFRLALSVTTTRLILLQGDAGSIVETFGNFVVGGNLVVGLVIFLILMIVNFLVITKGSERVAEVSARFTLDAMPGKQMSIDSDLRAGLLTAPEAKQKRADLGKESQLFGALDGAMKFVKGDAIAGIIIVLVNIIGGFSIGVMQLGLPAGESIKLYSILTIGDGLVAQIPALLISLTAGMLITRVKKDDSEDSNVGQELAMQLGSQPRALALAAIVLLGFGIIPGMPTLAFFLLSGIVGGIAAYQMLGAKMLPKQAINAAGTENESTPALQADNGETDIREFNVCERMAIVVAEGMSNDAHILEIVRKVRIYRNTYVVDRGFMFPTIIVIENKNVQNDEIQFRVYDSAVISATANMNFIAVDNNDVNSEKLESLGLEYEQGKASREEESLLWLPVENKDLLRENEVEFKDNLEVAAEKIGTGLLKYGHEFIGIEETNIILKWSDNEYPELNKELARVLPISRFSEVLQNLVSENVSIRPMRKIIETLVDQAAVERDIEVLTESVRVVLSRQICQELSPMNTMHVCLLNTETEELLRGAIRKTSTGGFFSLSQDERDGLLQNLKDQLSNVEKDIKPVVMVVAQDLRKYLREFIKNDFFKVPVLSYSEMVPTIDIKPVASI